MLNSTPVEQKTDFLFSFLTGDLIITEWKQIIFFVFSEILFIKWFKLVP